MTGPAGNWGGHAFVMRDRGPGLENSCPGHPVSLGSAFIDRCLGLANSIAMTGILTDCGCGHTQMRVTVMPKMRFRCHCTKCQGVYNDAYSDALVFRRGQVKPVNPDRVKWIRTMRITPLIRGLCKSCERPVLAHLYWALSVIPTATVSGIDIPPVSRDLYYRTRVADLGDDVPKHDSALATYAACTLPFAGVLLSPGQSLQPAK